MIYKIPVIKWWALCPAANDADAFDIPMRAVSQKWVYEGLGEYLQCQAYSVLVGAM